MPPTPRIRNGYLSFGARYWKMSKPLKRGGKRIRTTRRQRRGFLGPIVASALAPVAANLLNGTVDKIFSMSFWLKRIRHISKNHLVFFIAPIKMVVRCSKCMVFKKSHKSTCKKCRNSRRGQRGRGLEKIFKKAKRFVKKSHKQRPRKISNQPRFSPCT